MTTAFERLRAHLHTTQLLGSIHSALYYDQNTAMPSGGAPWRGEQLALLAGQLHERQSSAEYAALVEEASAAAESLKEQADGLLRAVGVFRVDAAVAAATPRNTSAKVVALPVRAPARTKAAAPRKAANSDAESADAWAEF